MLGKQVGSFCIVIRTPMISNTAKCVSLFWVYSIMSWTGKSMPVPGITSAFWTRCLYIALYAGGTVLDLGVHTGSTTHCGTARVILEQATYIVAFGHIQKILCIGTSPQWKRQCLCFAVFWTQKMTACITHSRES